MGSDGTDYLPRSCPGRDVSAVEGASLEDPRLVSLVRQALAYRNAEGVVVEIGDTRLAVRLGEPVAARVNEAMSLSRDPIGVKRLVDAERHGVSFARMLDLREGSHSRGRFRPPISALLDRVERPPRARPPSA
jgi:hypothetical protein